LPQPERDKIGGPFLAPVGKPPLGDLDLFHFDVSRQKCLPYQSLADRNVCPTNFYSELLKRWGAGIPACQPYLSSLLKSLET
jgi:hypothetical protein